MSKRDFYETLGVSKDADEKALKAAYRKLAMENHPDRNPDDPEAHQKFQSLGEAYRVLSSEQLRSVRDPYMCQTPACD